MNEFHEEYVWRKASKSINGGHCVEVAQMGTDYVLVRDSKNISGPHLKFSSKAWDSFIKYLKESK
jgi:hypothetical protein